MDIAAVAMRAVLEEEATSAIIVGVQSARHLARTLGAASIALSAVDRAEIAAAIADAPGPRCPSAEFSLSMCSFLRHVHVRG